MIVGHAIAYPIGNPDDGDCVQMPPDVESSKLGVQGWTFRRFSPILAPIRAAPRRGLASVRVNRPATAALRIARQTWRWLPPPDWRPHWPPIQTQEPRSQAPDWRRRPGPPVPSPEPGIRESFAVVSSVTPVEKFVHKQILQEARHLSEKGQGYSYNSTTV